MASEGEARRTSGGVSFLGALVVIGVCGAAGWLMLGTLGLLETTKLTPPIEQGGIEAPKLIPPNGPSAFAAGSTAMATSDLWIIEPAGEGGTVAILGMASDGVHQHEAAAIYGMLTRELVRQAMLIAARDGLNLRTRDGAIGEIPATDSMAEAPAFRLRSYFSRLGPHSIVLERVGSGGDEVVINESFTVQTGDWAVNLPPLIDLLDRFAHETFPDALRKVGVEPGKPSKAGGGLPEGVEGRLARLNFADQFAAVRALHRSIRDQGSSEERLGALVRGYAHLGVLTEDLPGATSKAYKARSLLYAQRMVAGSSGSPHALLHRAYARTFAGLHNVALEDLAASGDPEIKRPGWADLLPHACRSDASALAEIDIKRPEGPLARLLAYLAAERSTTFNMGSGIRFAGNDLVLEAADAALEANPGCDRVARGACRFGGVAHLHEATLRGPRDYGATLPARLRRLPEFPPEAAEFLDQRGGEPACMTALIEAGAPSSDAMEPSWAVLGRQMRDVRFVHALARLSFVRDRWNVPAADEVPAWLPLVADHPYRPLIESFAAPEGDPRFAEQFARVPFRDVGLADTRIYKAVRAADPMLGDTLHAGAIAHADLTAWDGVLLLNGVADSAWVWTAYDLLHVSPDAPLGMACVIEWDWDSVAGEVDGWLETHGEQPAILDALGRRYAALGRLDDAERLLNRCLEHSGDRRIYQALADIQRSRGHMDEWRATLDRFLETEEDRGLDHATVRVAMAEVYLDRGEIREAVRLAEAAAETWAGWAMEVAVRCNEAAGDLERAGLWARRISERYPVSSWPTWFLFCKRTGVGDLDAAIALADPYVESMADPIAVGWYHALAGRPERAVEHFRALRRADPSLTNCTQLVEFADDVGEVELRDEVLDAIRDNPDWEDSISGRILALLRPIIAGTPGAAPDLKALDALVDEGDASYPGTHGTYEFMIGRHLRRHGFPLEGNAYLRRCIASEQMYPWWRVAAICNLRESGAEQSVAAIAGGDSPGTTEAQALDRPGPAADQGAAGDG